jgi:hypothetical protein
MKGRDEGVTRSRREREGEKASELSINYEAYLEQSGEMGSQSAARNLEQAI